MEYYSIHMKLDNKDLRLLEVLKKDARLTTSQISKKLNIPITTVHNRIKKLTKEGVIKNYTINIDYKKLGKEISVYILINVIYTTADGKKLDQEEIANEIKKQEEVEEVSIVTGGPDIIVKVRTNDVEALNDFVIKRLRAIRGVDKTQTMVVLRQL